MKTTFEVLVLAVDRKALRFASNCHSKIRRLYDLKSWRQQIGIHYGTVGLLEIHKNLEPGELRQRLETASSVSRLSNHNQCVFALTDLEMARFGQQLLISGFAGVFCSQRQTNAFCQTLNRHAMRLRVLPAPLEVQISNRLPWQPESS